MAKRTSTKKNNQLDASMRIVALHGDDAFLMQEEATRFAEKLEAEFGRIQRFNFDGDRAELADVLDELRSYGLLGGHKLVIVDQAEQFLSGDARRRPMERYAESPVEDSTLMLRFGTWRSAGKFEKMLIKAGAVRDCSTPTPATAAAWARARCEKRYEAKLAPDAAALLVERTGPHLAVLDTELAKLATYLGRDGLIDKQLVMEMTEPTREEQAWEIQSTLLSGRSGRSIEKLRELREVSQLPDAVIMWAIMDLLRKLHTTSRAIAAGLGSGPAAKQAKLFGPARNAMISAAQTISPTQLAQLLHEAIETDRRTKRGLSDPIRSLEGLTVLVTDKLK